MSTNNTYNFQNFYEQDKTNDEKYYEGFGHPEEKLPSKKEMLVKFGLKNLWVDVSTKIPAKALQKVHYHLLKAINLIEASPLTNKTISRSHILICDRSTLKRRYGMTVPPLITAFYGVAGGFGHALDDKIVILTDSFIGKHPLWQTIIHEYGHRFFIKIVSRAGGVGEFRELYNLINQNDRYDNRLKEDGWQYYSPEEYESKGLPLPPIKPNLKIIDMMPKIGDPLSDLKINDWIVKMASFTDTANFYLTEIVPDTDVWFEEHRNNRGYTRKSGIYIYTNSETGEKIELTTRDVEKKIFRPSDYSDQDLDEFMAEMFALVVADINVGNSLISKKIHKHERWLVDKFLEIAKKYNI